MASAMADRPSFPRARSNPDVTKLHVPPKRQSEHFDAFDLTRRLEELSREQSGDTDGRRKTIELQISAGANPYQYQFDPFARSMAYHQQENEKERRRQSAGYPITANSGRPVSFQPPTSASSMLTAQEIAAKLQAQRDKEAAAQKKRASISMRPTQSSSTVSGSGNTSRPSGSRTASSNTTAPESKTSDSVATKPSKSRPTSTGPNNVRPLSTSRPLSAAYVPQRASMGFMSTTSPLSDETKAKRISQAEAYSYNASIPTVETKNGRRPMTPREISKMRRRTLNGTEAPQLPNAYNLTGGETDFAAGFAAGLSEAVLAGSGNFAHSGNNNGVDSNGNVSGGQKLPRPRSMNEEWGQSWRDSIGVAVPVPQIPMAFDGQRATVDRPNWSQDEAAPSPGVTRSPPPDRRLGRQSTRNSATVNFSKVRRVSRNRSQGRSSHARADSKEYNSTALAALEGKPDMPSATSPVFTGISTQRMSTTPQPKATLADGVAAARQSRERAMRQRAIQQNTPVRDSKVVTMPPRALSSTKSNGTLPILNTAKSNSTLPGRQSSNKPRISKHESQNMTPESLQLLKQQEAQLKEKRKSLKESSRRQSVASVSSWGGKSDVRARREKLRADDKRNMSAKPSISTLANDSTSSFVSAPGRARTNPTPPPAALLAASSTPYGQGEDDIPMNYIGNEGMSPEALRLLREKEKLVRWKAEQEKREFEQRTRLEEAEKLDREHDQAMMKQAKRKEQPVKEKRKKRGCLSMFSPRR